MIGNHYVFFRAIAAIFIVVCRILSFILFGLIRCTCKVDLVPIYRVFQISCDKRQICPVRTSVIPTIFATRNLEDHVYYKKEISIYKSNVGIIYLLSNLRQCICYYKSLNNHKISLKVYVIFITIFFFLFITFKMYQHINALQSFITTILTFYIV